MKNILYTLMVALLLIGCVTDDTVHDFKDLNAIEIKGLDEAYQFNYLESATIEPEVIVSGQSENDLEYRWYMYTASTQFVADTISREKNMNAIISASPGQAYTLIYSVKDLNTGIVYKKKMSAEVFGQLTQGMMFLAETNGNIDVNFVRPDGSVLFDVFTNANPGETFGTNPNKIQFVNPSPLKVALKNVYIFSNDADGGVLLNPITFKKEKMFRDAFYNSPTAATLNTAYYYTANLTDYLIVNGKAHNRAVNAGDPNWKPELVITDATIESKYNLAPFFMNDFSKSFPYPVMYDNLNGRFLKHEPANKGELTQFTGGSKIGFDYNNTGVKMLYKGVGITPTGYRGLYYYAICEGANDPSKRFMMKFLNGFKVLPPALELHGEELYELPAGDYPGLYGATVYAADDVGLKGVLWYSDGKKLYALNANDANPTEIVIRDFEAEGMAVDVLKMVRYRKDGAFVSELRIAVRNSNLASGQAGIVYMEAGTIGGLNATESASMFGLGDRIIDFDEKLN
ncbi:PKD-like family lipoprotein [Aestuariibaculum suncheonense]|uniref:PKD family protein n=1 Tax=Aestuariibaculum suncheonense TaxID=1028745 RepID=A0A8J6UJ78_9FLAO|nr:PKD-like family lipoprotein [Aestuariibaculum suncheonense]MBD0837014.1 hypothetical protein [Aestuariibaculum suncheonense]